MQSVSAFIRGCLRAKEGRRAVLDSGSPAALHEAYDALERAIYEEPFPGADLEWYKYASRVQSEIFYIDLFPYVMRLLSQVNRGARLRMLDVGTATGAGADLYGKIFKTTFTGYQIEVVGLDILSQFQPMAHLLNRNILNRNMRYEIGDVFDIPDGSYDIAVCSHTIEHIERPKVRPFIEKVIRTAAVGAIFYAPFGEENLLEGHLHSIDQAFVDELKPDWSELLVSAGWRHPVDSVSRCVVFGFMNKAPQRS